MMSEFYWRDGVNVWMRLFGFQLGIHPRGRRRLLSERYGYRKGLPTLRLGRKFEVSFCRLSRRRVLDPEEDEQP